MLSFRFLANYSGRINVKFEQFQPNQLKARIEIRTWPEIESIIALIWVLPETQESIGYNTRLSCYTNYPKAHCVRRLWHVSGCMPRESLSMPTPHGQAHLQVISLSVASWDFPVAKTNVGVQTEVLVVQYHGTPFCAECGSRRGTVCRFQ